MIGNMATFQFRVLRKTTELLATTPVAAVIAPNVAKSPLHPAHVQITLVGAGGLTGTVTVVGIVAGVADSEVVTFSGPVGTNKAIERTCKLFERVTSFSTTGLTDESPAPTITARFRGTGGEAVPTLCDLAECVFAHREAAGEWKTNTTGAQEGARQAKIDMDDIYGFDPRRGDLFVEQRDGVDLTTWLVVGPRPYLGGGFPHHWEIDVEERNALDVVESV